MINILIYLTNVPILEAMDSCEKERLFSLLPRHPENYYDGVSPGPVVIPESIILFSRRDINELVSPLDSLSGSLHHRYVLIYNRKASFSLMVDHQKIQLIGEECLLIHPFQYHSFFSAESGRCPLEALFITFDLASGKSLYLKKLRGKPVPVNGTESDRLFDIVRIYMEEKDHREAMALQLALVLAGMSRKAGRNEEEKIGFREEGLIPRVCRAVYNNPALTIDDLALAFSLSKGYLRTLFKEALNQSLGDYILALRVSRARMMLAGSDDSVSLIGEVCGYATLYSFSRMFKEKTGQSPTEFRRESRGRLSMPASRS